MRKSWFFLVWALLLGGGCRKARKEMGASLVVSRPLVFVAESAVPLPEASFDPQSATNGWEISAGVAIDPDRGGKAPGALKISVDAKMTGAQTRMSAPVRLAPWRWHRLTFVYQLSPGVSAGFAWTEKDANGIAHPRDHIGRVRLSPTGAFAPVRIEFISWHAPAEWTLTFRAHLTEGASKPGCFLVDDVTLERGPAAAVLPAETFPRAVPNHGFESAQVIGDPALFGEADLLVADDPTAYEGKRCLRLKPKGDKGSAHIYIPKRGDLVLQHGHAYRVSAQARGTGGLCVGLLVERWWLDIPWQASRNTFPLSADQWREVSADFIIDRGDVREFQVMLLPEGAVDIDAIEIRRIR